MTLNAALSDHEVKLETVNAALSDRDAELATANATLSDRVNQIAALEQKNQELEGELKTAFKLVTGLEGEITHLEATNVAITEKAVTAFKDLQELEAFYYGTSAWNKNFHPKSTLSCFRGFGCPLSVAKKTLKLHKHQFGLQKALNKKTPMLWS